MENKIKIEITKNGYEVLYNNSVIQKVIRVSESAVQPTMEYTEIIEDNDIPNYLALLLDENESFIQSMQDYIYEVEELKDEYLMNPDVSDFYIDDTNY